MSVSRVAVLGCGYWGQNLVRNFDALGGLRLVCDPVEQARVRAEQLAPGVETCPDFESVFDRPDIDAVVISTPAETHYSLAMRAMAAGKDVLVEKPLALSLREGRLLQDAARRTGCVLLVGHLLEYHPAILKMRELFESGRLGKVNYIYSNRLNFGKVRTEENALWSFAPHDIAVILRLYGEMPIEVTCVGGCYLTPNLPDTTVSCLHFRGGQRAHVFVSWLNPFKEQKLVVVGDKKMAVFNDVIKEDKLVLYNQWVEMSSRQPILQKGESEAVPISADEPLRKQCQEFLNCIQERRTPLTDVDSGLQVLAVLQACQVSLQLNGRPTVLANLD